MDPVLLRQTLAAFLGDDQFRKLVVQHRWAGRLRYWHEEALARFADARPDVGFSPDDLALALRVCEVHGQELLADTVEVCEGCVAFADDYARASRESFPNAMAGPLYTQGAPSRDPHVWYCPDCRLAEAAWMASRKR